MGIRDDLQSIDGVGPKTTDSIMSVFEDYEQDADPEVYQQVEKALEYFDQGDYSYGEKFLSRVVDE